MSRLLSILLVEDNPGDVRLVRETLSEGGLACRLEVASDGVEALEILRRERDAELPDLILLDLNLPRMNGFELLRVVKEDSRWRSIPVIVLSSSDSEDDVRRAYDLQANCYVTKPLDSAGLGPVLEIIERFWTDVVKLPPRGQ